MQALFFGHSQTPLYGMMHEPRSDIYRHSAVLICQPPGHEYFCTHRALGKLAHALSGIGYPVMRFDYRGTGDSHGSFRDLTLDTLREDTVMAWEELQAVSAMDNVLVIAVRLGALIAALASRECEFSHHIFWDARLDGRQYIDDLSALHSELLGSSYYYLQPRSTPDKSEMLGYRYGEELLSGLAQCDQGCLSELSGPLSLLATDPAADEQQLRQRLDTDFQFYPLQQERGWNDILAVEHSLTANAVIQKILELLD